MMVMILVVMSSVGLIVLGYRISNNALPLDSVVGVKDCELHYRDEVVFVEGFYKGSPAVVKGVDENRDRCYIVIVHNDRGYPLEVLSAPVEQLRKIKGGW